MSRNMTILFLLLILIMMGAIGFLGMRVSELDDLYHASKNTEQTEVLDAQKVTKTMDGLKEELRVQKDALLEFSSTLTKVSKLIKHLSGKTWMPAPEFAISDTVFSVSPAGENTFDVVADKNRLLDWFERNELFLEHLILKTFPLEYDRTRRQVVVQDITPNSIFNQMGIQKGDGILSIDGKVLMRGPDIREALTEVKQKQIVISRDNKRYILNVTYEGKLEPKNQVSLDISKKQFDEALPKLLQSLKMAPALKDGDILGIKIMEMEPANVLALMNLQAHDIITKINGDRVTEGQLVATFKDATDPLVIDYLRDDEVGSVLVKFSK